MAPVSAPKRTTVPFSQLLLIFLMASMHHQPVRAIKSPAVGTTKLVFYIQDFSSGPDATVIPVAGIAGKLWTFTQFGTIYIADDFLTETPNPNSARIGRAQGIYTISSLDGSNAHVSFTIVFTSGAYNGSTLEIGGSENQQAAVTELAVTGGTGKLRFARGYTTLESLSFDSARAYTLIRCNVTFRLD